MSVYPDSLQKLSEASGPNPVVNGTQGQYLRDWAKSKSEYLSKFIIAVGDVDINDPTHNGQNVMISAYDFIEKSADAVVTSISELTDALADSTVTSIFLADTSFNNNTYARPFVIQNNLTISTNKVLFGVNSLLDLNGKIISLGSNVSDLKIYCKVRVSNSSTIKGLGNNTVYIKDIWCNGSTNQLNLDGNGLKVYYERFYNSSIQEEIRPDTLNLSDKWEQKFFDNTFPWNSIKKLVTDETNRATTAESNLNNKIDAETTRATNAEQAEADARAAADTTLQANIDTEAATRARDDATLQANIDAEALARQNADTDLRNDINALEGGSNGEYVYGINKANDGTLTRKTHSVDTSITDKSSEDYAVPTVKAIKSYVDTNINKVYKPAGDAYIRVNSTTHIATLHTSNDDSSSSLITPAAGILGNVYNVVNAEPDVEYNFGTYSLFLSPYEDVGVVESENSYVFNDLGGKINLNNYYTKSEVDAMAAASKTTVSEGNNTHVTSTENQVDHHIDYKIDADKSVTSVAASTIANDTTNTIKLTSDTTSNNTNSKTYTVNIADSSDITAIKTWISTDLWS